MSRSTNRLLVAVAAVGLAAFGLPANAAEPAYSPGDTVTVDGASVTAPAAGNTVVLTVDRVDGDSTTLVASTDASGAVTVADGDDTVATDKVAADRCDDKAYSLISGVGWDKTYKWHFKKSSTPSYLGKKAAKKDLKAAVKNITTSDNKCGMADKVSATADYQGSTSSSSDVTSAPACVASPNGLNVTEFADIQGSGILAATCTYSNSNEITNASVRINTDFTWWISGGCSGDYSLEGVQTHEYGHAFGLGHVDEATHGDLTMSTNIDACSKMEKNLGKGDVLGLRALY